MNRYSHKSDDQPDVDETWNGVVVDKIFVEIAQEIARSETYNERYVDQHKHVCDDQHPDEVKKVFQVYDTELLALEGQHKKTYVEHHCHAPGLVVRID